MYHHNTISEVSSVTHGTNLPFHSGQGNMYVNKRLQHNKHGTAEGFNYTVLVVTLKYESIMVSFVL